MRAHQIITETVEEQRDIIKMAQKIINWYKNTVGDMRSIVKQRQSLAAQSQDQDDKLSELIPDFIKPYVARSNFDRTNKLNTPIYLQDVVGRNYTSETIRKWLSTKPIVIFATDENREYGITTDDLQKTIGWWDYHGNLIVVSCIEPESVYSNQTLSTLVHEIQHGLDMYKSKLLAGLKSKSGRGGSTTRAQQEVTDIQIILAAFKKKLRIVPKSGIMVKNIISSAMLQSDIFKKLANDPEFANIKIASSKNWDNNISDEDYPSRKTPIEELFWWMPDCLLHESSEEFFYRLQQALVEYRSSHYEHKKGYSDKVRYYDKDQSDYYSKNLEINARILQAFNDIVVNLKNAGFKGYSSDPKIYKQQQDIIAKHVTPVLISTVITKELWPKNKQEERWRRLNNRTQQFIRQNFPRTSNVLPKNPRRSEIEEIENNDFLLKLLYLLDKI